MSILLELGNIVFAASKRSQVGRVITYGRADFHCQNPYGLTKPDSDPCPMKGVCSIPEEGRLSKATLRSITCTPTIDIACISRGAE